MAGYPRWTSEDKFIDYKEYLGADWTPEYEGASTLISNHVSWIDGCFYIMKYYSCLVTREGFKNTPFLGSILKSLACVFIKGTGKDAK